jgi:hypothetical protein
MGRRVSSGVVGGTGLGSLSVVSAVISSTVTDGDITLEPNGTGSVLVEADLFLHDQGDLQFGDADSSNYVAIQAPAAVATNYTLTLPAAVAGTNGFALVSDTNGTLSWSPAGAALTDNNADSATNYIPFTTQTQSDGFLTAARVAVATRVLSYQPSTGTLTTTILSAGTINETSSIALKENFRPIDDALDKILQLTGLVYDRKDGSTKDEAGLIAEDVNEVIPNVVGKDQDGNPATIAYQRLTAYLIEAVKTLNTEINEMKGIK